MGLPKGSPSGGPPRWYLTWDPQSLSSAGGHQRFETREFTPSVRSWCSFRGFHTKGSPLGGPIHWSPSRCSYKLSHSGVPSCGSPLVSPSQLFPPGSPIPGVAYNLLYPWVPYRGYNRASLPVCLSMGASAFEPHRTAHYRGSSEWVPI
jgi:hypothetical protein